MNQVQQFLEYIFNSFKIWIIIQPWEAGLRVRMGKHIKKLKGGMYFKIPYLDSVYVQEIRLRVLSMPIQTLTSKDGKSITMAASMGYIINNIEKVYQTLYHPELTLVNMAMAEITEYIANTDASLISFVDIQDRIKSKINEQDYGIDIQYYKMNNFAIVRTYRLIQDQSWVHEGLSMDNKK